MVQHSIPTFLLYGEEAVETPAEFAHIETIAARSSLHDWEIAPHRHHQSVQILIVTNGQVTFRCDDRTERLHAPCFMAVPVGSVHGFQFQPETTGFVLSVSPGFLARATGAADPLLRLLTHGASGPIAASHEPRATWISRELLALQADWRAPSPLFLSLLEALVRSLQDDSVPATADTEDDTRLSRFRQLVELHLTAHHPVAWYAGQLGISSKTLIRTCRRQLDCTPTELIHNRLLLEAQRMLCFTNASIVQVAEDMGFSDPSYFSRFYRRLTGRRPLTDKSALPQRG
ncbi:helix-turn-helix domain-containing protein [Novosphingobium album (ex Hu et al. 2023)]|uniref:Helix-turn-helix domain-containing protein n=1 Tax=Novosphingobium album (ex Hu et al. 2023) TaxID=2930093 RepID=A0ABT0B7C3_9SPHN|nr:helix-turn-helix domain-containing protein [Novosphingobium album (ex Hu et al. 2023)]MCJ2180970.1 helix-turn-helix domain-containing protein [Novosphingobium album (ex Hu et al. 2023)]